MSDQDKSQYHPYFSPTPTEGPKTSSQGGTVELHEKASGQVDVVRRNILGDELSVEKKEFGNDVS